jgi:hypothetical protein
MSFSFFLAGMLAVFALIFLVLRSQSHTRDGRALCGQLAGISASLSATAVVLGVKAWLVPLLVLAFVCTKVSPFRRRLLFVPILVFIITGVTAFGVASVGTLTLVITWTVLTIISVAGWFWDGMKTARW